MDRLEDVVKDLLGILSSCSLEEIEEFRCSWVNELILTGCPVIVISMCSRICEEICRSNQEVFK